MGITRCKYVQMEFFFFCLTGTGKVQEDQTKVLLTTGKQRLRGGLGSGDQMVRTDTLGQKVLVKMIGYK